MLDLWEAQDGEGRWTQIEYLVRDGRFEVTYGYSDGIDSEELWVDRRARVVQRYFGDKPTVYPPWEDDDVPQYEL